MTTLNRQQHKVYKELKEFITDESINKSLLVQAEADFTAIENCIKNFLKDNPLRDTDTLITLIDDLRSLHEVSSVDDEINDEGYGHFTVETPNILIIYDVNSCNIPLNNYFNLYFEDDDIEFEDCEITALREVIKEL